MTSALRRSVNVGSAAPASASRSSRSHCGTIAMCLCGPGSRLRSPIWTVPLSSWQLRPVEAALRQRGEPLAEPQLVQQRQRGGVHGVAAEVAQEVGVLLQHGDLDAGPGQQQPQDHPGGPAADHEAGRALVIRHALNIAPTRARRQPAPPHRMARSAGAGPPVAARGAPAGGCSREPVILSGPTIAALRAG